MFNSRNITVITTILFFTITTIVIQILTPKTAGKTFYETPKLERTETFHTDTHQNDTLSKDSSGLFDPLPPPGPNDWLANHHEYGQTFKQYLSAPKNSLNKSRNTIYILPMWDFDKKRSPSLELLQKYTEIYYSVPVKLLPPMNPSKNEFTPRINSHTGKEQVHAGQILTYLLKQLPEDAYCIIGITMADLYPDPMWNFVFGYASYTSRVGIFSFARFDQSFYDEKDSTDHKLLFMRSCKVLTHETGHMFGLAHCTAYHCNLNGSNNLSESDAQPIHLCPVCLKKLQYAVGFDITRRYRELGNFYAKQGFILESKWIELRLDYLQENN